MLVLFSLIKHFLVLAVTDAKWIFTGIYYIGILKKFLPNVFKAFLRQYVSISEFPSRN